MEQQNKRDWVMRRMMNEVCGQPNISSFHTHKKDKYSKWQTMRWENKRDCDTWFDEWDMGLKGWGGDT